MRMFSSVAWASSARGETAERTLEEMSWQRIVAQVVITGTQIVGKAFLQAQASGCKRREGCRKGGWGCGEERTND